MKQQKYIIRLNKGREERAFSSFIFSGGSSSGRLFGERDGVEVPESSIFKCLLDLCKITEINSFYLVDKLQLLC